MISKIRESRYVKVVIVITILSFINSLVTPNICFAITGGPSQPEVQSFEPVGTSEMVDLFTGDFVYNIPLMDVGGYPINISYHSGISMDDEASWVGLGWNINAGVINRTMRGIPDDFKLDDKIIKSNNLKTNTTLKLNVGVDLELFPVDITSKIRNGNSNGSLSFGLGVYYNNYKGIGYETSAGISAGPVGLNVGFDSQNGLDISPSISFGKIFNKNTTTETENNFQGGGSISVGYNSRSGLKDLSFSYSCGKQSTKTKEYTDANKITYNRTEKSEIYGANGGSSISFANSTYVPSATPGMYSTSLSFTGKLGLSFSGVDPTFMVGVLYTEQGLFQKVKEYPSYGYIYSEFAKDDQNALMDFNREKDASLAKYTTNLPVTNNTYDVYSVSGQGTGGIYRPYRSNIGSVYDPKTRIGKSKINNDSKSLSLEFGVGGNSLKIASNLNLVFSRGHSKRWDANPYKQMYSKSNADISTSDPKLKALYEPCYFKNVGEKTQNDLDYYNSFNGTDVLSPTISTSPAPHPTSGMASKQLNCFKQKREKRNQNIQVLTAEEATNFGLNKGIESRVYNDNNECTSECVGIARVDDITRKKHHISEITCTNPDGSRYVYGIPAYNLKQKEVSFAVSHQSVAPLNGLCPYTSTGANPDNSLYNKQGLDNFYSSNEIPPYAHSYLLTAVLSPDYVDINDDGPDDYDYGTYTKINYQKASISYKWRTPASNTPNIANYNEGYKTDPTDDKANYIYGEKEIWYISSIETKTHIAIFHTSKRADGFGVSDENGGIDTVNTYNSSQKLDYIVLFNKSDWKKNPETAIPIKKVVFKYNYKLCKNVYNNKNYGVSTSDEKGKLTLEKIWFEYQNNKRGSLSPYIFDYKENVTITGPGNKSYKYNPNYDTKCYDRWGNYKDYTQFNNYNPSSNNNLSNSEFPYVDQNEEFNLNGTQTTLTDFYASAWSLRVITLPSGGKITVNYESDDYAYVQNKPAMQMFKIAGIDGNENFSNHTKLFEPPTIEGIKDKNWFVKEYIYFDLKPGFIPDPSHLSPQQIKDYIKFHYLNGVDKLYYNVLVNLASANASNADKKWEYVQGYADINDWGVCPGPTPIHGYVHLKGVDIGELLSKPLVNPISKSAWQMTKLNLPFVVNPAASLKQSSTSNNTQKTASLLLGSLQDIVNMFMGQYTSMAIKQYGCDVDINKSWIRLSCPGKDKMGGGVRVSKLEFSDEWTEISNNTEPSATYGQEYTYTIKEKQPDNSIVEISSGVASYEPLIGGDENPFRQPHFFHDKIYLSPDNLYYIEDPMGECYFPSPSIGYRQVTVKNISYPGNDHQLKKHATGKTVHEFYTAYDFPTITKAAPIYKAFSPSISPLSLLGLKTDKFAMATQGYLVELNDMHGKPKAQWVYSENNDPANQLTTITDPTLISGIEYYYKVDDETSQPKHLNNVVTVLNKDGSIENDASIGVEVDMVGDFRDKMEHSVRVGTQVNLDILFTGLPLLVPGILPSFAFNKTKVNTAVYTKVVNRYGVLTKTIAHDGGAKLETENIAWDSETGEVLLTKTQNEYGDYVYNLTYPAHWAYSGMGASYQNQGAVIDINITNGVTENQVDDVLDILFPGDEVILTGDDVIKNNPLQTYPIKCWVLDKKITPDPPNLPKYEVSFIKYNGDPPINGNYNLKILRSGHRNQQSTPIATVSLMSNPLVYADQQTTPFGKKENFSGVLNASAVEYSDHWQTYADNEQNYCSCNLTTKAEELLQVFKALPKLSDWQTSESFNLSTIPAFSNSSIASSFPNYHRFYKGTLSSVGSITNTQVIDNILNGDDEIIDVVKNAANIPYIVISNGKTIKIVTKDGNYKYPQTEIYSTVDSCFIKSIDAVKFYQNKIVMAGIYHRPCDQSDLNLGYKELLIVCTWEPGATVPFKHNIYKALNEIGLIRMYPKSLDFITDNGGTKIGIAGYSIRLVESPFVTQPLPFYIPVEFPDAISTPYPYVHVFNILDTKPYFIKIRKLDDDKNIYLIDQVNSEGGEKTAYFTTDKLGSVDQNNDHVYSFITKSQPKAVDFDFTNMSDLLIGINHSTGFGVFDPNTLTFSDYLSNAGQPALINTFKAYPYLSLTGSFIPSNGQNNTGFIYNADPSNNNPRFYDKFSSGHLEWLKTNQPENNYSWGRIYGPNSQSTSNIVFMKRDVSENYVCGNAITLSTQNSPEEITTTNFSEDGYLSQTESSIFDFNATTFNATDVICGSGILNDDCQVKFTSASAQFNWNDVTDFENLRYVKDKNNCDNEIYKFKVDVVLFNGSRVTIDGISCFPIAVCTINTCAYSVDQILNPYVAGIRGTWRPKKNYVYFDRTTTDNAQREQASATPPPNVNQYNYTNTRTDGTIRNFVPFWTSNAGSDWSANPTNPWTLKSDITKYCPYGFEVENKDALNIYSAALYGYNHKLPVAVAQNARYQQVAYDGFEDYDVDLDKALCVPDHFSFRNSLDDNAKISNIKAHTGIKSLELEKSGTASVNRNCKELTTQDNIDFMTFYNLQKEDVLGYFTPTAGTYLLGYWVSAASISETANASITIKVNGKILNLGMANNEIAVEGWLRREYKFEITGKVNDIEIILVSNSDSPVYFDDIRIHPYEGNMKTFVYNIISQKLMAQLDENNYATFYEYDQEGNLVRIKRETEKGIMTIQESRQNIYIKPPPPPTPPPPPPVN